MQKATRFKKEISGEPLITDCNEKVVAELIAHGVDSTDDLIRYRQLGEVDTPFLMHNLGSVVVRCADCAFDGGRSCPTKAAKAVYEELSSRGQAWPVFGWMWSANGTDLDYM